MKTALRVSILFNACLLGWLIFSLIRESKPVAAPTSRAIAETRPAAADTMAAPTRISAPVKPEPFRWSQLYARDYHVYVSNLRSIGCPEQTLRVIVGADVHVVFAQRIQELEKRLSDMENSSWSVQLAGWRDEKVWKDELQRLPDEESEMLAEYLGEKPATASPVLSSENNVQTTDTSGDDQPSPVPLVAQPIDLAALNLDGGQLEAITNLQNIFLQKIGGPNQDPNDPAYRARWRAAQTEVDSMMQGMLGDQAYQEYQLMTFASAQANQGQNSASPGASAPSGTAGE